MTQLDLIDSPILLKDARDEVEASLDKGSICPCCSQLAKLYRRKLNSNMAAFLVSLARRCRERERDGEEGWAHFSECTFTGRDYSYLRAWGLVEMQPSDNTTKRASGCWRPTSKGFLFARGLARVPLRVHLYNNKVRGFSWETTDIRTALGDHFDYNELYYGKGESSEQ